MTRASVALGDPYRGGVRRGTKFGLSRDAALAAEVQIDWVGLECAGLARVAFEASRRARRYARDSQKLRGAQRAVREAANRVLFLLGACHG